MLVTEARRAWALPHLPFAGQLAASQLVTNAVEHACTELLLAVARRGHGLHLAVRHGSSDRPCLPASAPAGAEGADDHGRELRIVQQVARAWGAVPTRDGAGKVVWASLQP